ncbi:Major Facilitator Superfamily protein [Actinobaculum suis]|uniref:EmrB/QacA family drug resistance transporter n=1 Tax=Actinobaculum suis TaxID=1657 RepID=A0A1G7BHZ4_9ACTO|nr:MFS transporter [Actinobaculum suis]MDY5153721.1 MFS transporter [Actinobaculum suis]SDE26582.1 Major Facilitator Superfamily protein [Actinobaculum suis]VDG76571.1 EmrB/QacA family drug resistance transporter [Actinobaculum suis]
MENNGNTRFFRVPGSDREYDRNKLLLVLLVSLVISLIQVSSVNNLLPVITLDLHAERSDLQWVLSGYALLFGLALVPAGRLGDIFGRSMTWMIGVAIFTLGCVLCGSATTPTILNLARALQGLGAGVFSPQVTGLIQQFFSGHARAKAFSYMGLAISASVAVGPLISGSLVQFLGNAGWRWSFFFNVPLGLLGIVLGFFWLPFSKERRTIGPSASAANREYRAKQRARGRKPARKRGDRIDLDPIGMLLLTVSVLGIMLPFMTDYSWRWFMLLGAVVLMAVWVWWEGYYPKRGGIPMVNLRLFTIESFSYGVAIAGIQFLGTTSVFVVLALVFQQGLGFSALMAGLIGLPNALLSAYFAVWSGKRAVTHGRRLQTDALLIMFVSLLASIGVAWGVLTAGWNPWWIMVPIGFFGIGQGIMGSVNQTVTMSDVPRAHGGTAGGIQQTAQRITTAIGNAMITAILFTFVSDQDNASLHDWAIGYAGSIGTICVIVACSLILAFIFQRRPLQPAPADRGD